MRFNGLRWLPLLWVSIAIAPGADNEKSKLIVRPAADYPNHQTSEKVTIAAQLFLTDEEAQEAFGKLNPYRMGVLPVLLVIQNDGPDAIRLDGMKSFYILPDRTRIEATPAQEVKYLKSAKVPSLGPKPLGGLGQRKPKNPLAEWEIEGRAFAAKMLPTGQSASGFVYFQTGVDSQAASLEISGLKDPVSGKELYYFEIPLSGK